jgi:Na+/proline symporter
MYTSGALGCVAAGLYWRKANTPGAYASLIMGAAAPAGFLLLEKSRDVLPSWLLFVADVNIAGLLSFVLAAAGMIGGSLLTQKTSSPKQITTVEER